MKKITLTLVGFLFLCCNQNLIAQSSFVLVPENGCNLPHTVFFTDTSSSTNAFTSWLYDFGDGSTSTSQNPIHNFNTPGTFTITQTVTTPGNTPPVSMSTQTVQVVLINADFTEDVQFGCGPLTVNFSDATTIAGGTITNWDWDFGDGNTSTNQNPTHTYETSGSYTVTLTTTADNGCPSTETKSNYINVIGPDVDFSALSTTTGASPLTVDFNDTTVFSAPIVSWSWVFGDGNSSGLQNPSNVYTDCGTFDVSLTVTDIDGCSRTEIKPAFVTVTDETAPTALCQNITVQLDQFGEATIVASDLDGGSTDNCGNVTFSASQTAFTCEDLENGGTPAPLLITGVVDADLTGGTPKAVELKVQEDIADLSLYGLGSANNGGGSDGEEFTFPADAVTAGTFIYVATDDAMFSAFFGFDPTYINGAVAINGDDAIELFFNGVVIDTFGDINVNGDGEVWEYTDGWAYRINNTGPDGTTFNPNYWNYSGPGALDGETTNGTAATPFPIGAYTTASGNAGEVTVTLTVTDENGNSATCDALVTVQDMIPPAIVCPPTVITENDPGLCEASGVELGSTFVNDNCSANITVTNNAPATFPVGTTEVTWFAEDEYGNVNSCIQMVTVEDNEPPMVICNNITIALDVNGEASITAAMLNNGSSDNCGILSVSISEENFTCENLGENEVQLFVTDVNGNIQDCTAIVTVEDNIAPTVICLNPSVELDENGMATIDFTDLLDPASTDNCEIVSGTVSMETFTCENQGENEVILTVEDAAGNQATCTATVTIIPNSLPVAVCQNITVALDETGQATITAEDVDGDSEASTCGELSFSINIDTFTCDNIGENTVVLTVEDANGNEDTCEAIVTVIDETAPEAVCENITVSLNDDGTVTILAADIDGSSTANCGAVSLSIDQDTFDCSHVGENEVILTVTDDSGNSATCAAIVTVEDNTPPMAMCQNITLTLNENGLAFITADDINNGSSDVCTEVETSIDVSEFNCEQLGDNTVVLTVTDSNGNISTCEATVTVVANTAAPEALCENITVALNEDGMAFITPANIDAGSTGLGCDNGLAIDIDTFTCEDIGINDVTLTVTNGNGESSSCVAAVNVVDTLAPTIMCPEELVILAELAPYELPDFVANGTVTIEDNCNDTVTIIQEPAMSTLVEEGETAIVITATDPSGNSVSCDFTIFVDPSLGINPNAELLDTLSLYPNPASAFIVLENPNNLSLKNAQLIDVTGRIVKQFDLSDTSPERILDISEIASASYFLIVEGTEGSVSFQIIKS